MPISGNSASASSDGELVVLTFGPREAKTDAITEESGRHSIW